MHYQVNITHNLRCLQTGLPETAEVTSDSPLSIAQITGQLGVNPLLIVVAVVEGKARSLDYIVEKDAAINLIGPVAGG